MSLRDVNITVTDGLMGGSGIKGEGIHLLIGASPITSAELLPISGSLDHKKIKARLGLSPLADACMDAIENGSDLIYCMPVMASTAGAVGAVKSEKTGKGTFAITGEPNNGYSIQVKITETGKLNAALFQYSINGGYSFSDELTVPTGGSFEVEHTGLTFVFTEALSQDDLSFAEGDTFTALATAPKLTNADILTAIGRIKNLQEEFEMVHIAGETTEASWAAVSEIQKELCEKLKRPLQFVLEAYAPNADETAVDYAKRLVKSAKAVRNTDLQIVASRSMYQHMDGAVSEVNHASIVCGLYAQARVSQSIGETKRFAVADDKMLDLIPARIADELEFLDAAGYLTFRQYNGLAGKYVTNARMMCPEGSDYKYAEYVRCKNKIMRAVRKEALMQMQAEIDPKNLEVELQTMVKFICTPIDEMVRRKEISSYRTVIPAQDILSRETVSFTVRFVPIGHAREFAIDLGMENPYKQ